mmetsp:Transcript_9079/g.11527  ORF Transcript_9079/g.11527 Transcript_9079/m.11527 type:complete len:98 (-) Transcript_9079:342-635(-)
MKFVSAPNARDNQQTDDWHHRELVKMKLHGQFFCTTGQNPTGGPRPIGSLVDPRAPLRQDGSNTLRCHGTDSGNEQQDAKDLQARPPPALLPVSTER